MLLMRGLVRQDALYLNTVSHAHAVSSYIIECSAEILASGERGAILGLVFVVEEGRDVEPEGDGSLRVYCLFDALACKLALLPP